MYQQQTVIIKLYKPGSFPFNYGKFPVILSIILNHVKDEQIHFN